MTTRANRYDAVRMNREMLSSMSPPTWRWYLLAAVLGAVVAFGLYAFTVQVTTGMGVTGINRPVMWGIYIISFVFWVGLSHSGTMVSAILRLSKASWRRPILRGAEAMTVFSISVAGLFPLIHLGRNWIFYYLLPYPNQRGLWPNFRSPLLFDMVAINTYIIGSTIFLYIGLLPDLAVVRDCSSGWKKKIYAILAMGWRGSAEQWQVFSRGSTLLACLIIPVAVSVHSIVAWDFAVTLVPGWHSTIFAPYFVIGAITSGVAAVITLMIVIRKLFKLEEFLQPVHFDNMAKLLLAVCLLWSYFYFSEVFTTWYAHKPIEWEIFSFMSSRYGIMLLIMMLGNTIVPIIGLCFRQVRRSLPALLVITLLVNLAMFIERFLIVVPSLSHKNIPFIWGSYTPSWVELAIMVASFALFFLLYTLFAKFFPILAITDVREQEEVLLGSQQNGRTRLETLVKEE
ncbi:NrfD/PsrC family molybdoenzyme membrane anchor subunit [Malonomonas rubra]|uniref:NrfD/PsrC family molybdoenzyme membrane anchor subunit n=1 Tax=Malonomonas rubra TaxID=57040 RepID=UPI0026EC7D92|nr:NrfD/PsrC family molybdoenzyme membrane anchor subunit [Malonomonas rubra]